MVGAVIVTHGGLAKELLEATERIVGPTERLHAVTIGWDDDVDQARAQIGAAIRAVDAEQGVVVFTDMFGGTPTNVSIGFLEPDRVEIITGVNLPMLVKFTNLQHCSDALHEIAVKIRDRGQKSVYVASETLSSQERL